MVSVTSEVSQIVEAEPSTELERFAAKHRLKTRLDECGEKIIPGRQGQIYEWGVNTDTGVFELGAMFMPPKTAEHPWGRWMPRTWGNFKRVGLALMMTVRQSGDSEGCLSFDPANPAQVKLAMKVARVYPKRVMSEEHLAKLRAGLPGCLQG
jgi:hypothetical protein